jgi:probable addiction module antidote protein
MKLMITEFDPTTYLDHEDVIAEYLSAALAEGDLELLQTAISNVVKARGIAHIARAAGLRRASLSQALAHGAKPRFATVMKIMRALGVKLQVQAT